MRIAGYNIGYLAQIPKVVGSKVVVGASTGCWKGFVKGSAFSPSSNVVGCGYSHSACRGGNGGCPSDISSQWLDSCWTSPTPIDFETVSLSQVIHVRYFYFFFFSFHYNHQSYVLII